VVLFIVSLYNLAITIHYALRIKQTHKNSNFWFGCNFNEFKLGIYPSPLSLTADRQASLLLFAPSWRTGWVKLTPPASNVFNWSGTIFQLCIVKSILMIMV